MGRLRTNFCWACSRKLWGNKYATRVIEEHERTLHKSCAAEYDEGREDRIMDQGEVLVMMEEEEMDERQIS